LWASTGTKNPEYRDVLYVEELIGPDTVNTLPPATLAAFRDHGLVRASLFEDVEGAAETMSQLAQEGIPIEEVTDLLLEQGVKLFDEAFDKLLAAITTRAGMVVSGMVDLDTSTEPAADNMAPRASTTDKRPTER
jgi:transaldolase